MPRFKQMPDDPKQMWLLPPSLDELISADSEVRLLCDVMDALDWSIMEKSYARTGRPAYPPNVLTKILVYAYSKGIRSSRRIQELVECDIRYIWLCGGLKPDHNTIARFRKDKFKELCQLFVDCVRLCKESGLVLLNIVAVDGTKIPANASRRSMYDQKRLARELEAVEKILLEAEETDKAEDDSSSDNNETELPEHMKDAKQRKLFLEEMAKKLKDSGASMVSSTDEECRMMKTKNGFKPCFNIQAAVDESNQVILAAKLVQSRNDSGQLPDMLEDVKNNTGMAPCMALADTGYYDEKTLKFLESSGQEALISPKLQPQSNKRDDLFCSRCFIRDEDKDMLICPAGRELHFSGEFRSGSGVYRQYSARGCSSCSFQSECVTNKSQRNRRVHLSCISDLREKMLERIKSESGRALFALRKQIVEPVFGQTKHNRHFTGFLMRGVDGASAEMALIFLAHNLFKVMFLFLSGLLSKFVNAFCLWTENGNPPTAQLSFT